MTLPERFWDAEGFDVEGFDAALEAAEPVELEVPRQEGAVPPGSEGGGRPSWVRSVPESASRPPMPMDVLLTLAAVATVIAVAVAVIVILLMSPSAGWSSAHWF